ncbi:MAG: rRNA maturation RNase YbeY [Deltaproteobacteria bacterium]|jgi:rRNA maturation RNase YbeY|nr:rRNA maturation RNase YbeY [Deltaproteobacteria bacterium]
MTVRLISRSDLVEIKALKIKRRLGKVLKELALADQSLTVLFTDDREIKALNKQFRGKNSATNVLAFSNTELALGFPNYLGDLVLSIETLIKQSKKFQVDLGYLLHFYMIHGLLHLIGFDHEISPLEDQRQEEETLRLMSLIKHDL